MSLLVADQLSFGWSSNNPLFENLSFSIGRERVGLLGPNGVGKSTLIQLLIGAHRPVRGHVSQTGRLLYLPQRIGAARSIGHVLGIADKLKALARVEAGNGIETDFALIGDDWDLEDRAYAALKALRVPRRSWDAPISQLSGGQIMRLRLARVTLERPDMLIMDEPTNDLDAEGLEVLNALIREWRAGLLVVSHDRTLLSNMDRILELGQLGLKSYGGAYDVYAEAKAIERAAAAQRLSEAEKQVRQARKTAQVRHERDARRAAQGRRTKPGSVTKMVLDARKERAQATSARTRDQGLRDMSEADAARDTARQAVEVQIPLQFDLPSTGLARQKRVLRISDLTLRHPGAPKPLFQDLNIEMVGPARLAITGPNGVGKSTLLQAVMGTMPIEGGTIDIGVERVAYLDQAVSNASSDTALVDAFLAQNPEHTPQGARAALARFGFRNQAADVPLAQLSGGESLRAALAIALMSATPPQLLILDEPTNHMDLESIETLETALSAYDGAILVVSHDAWFLEAVGVERSISLA